MALETSQARVQTTCGCLALSASASLGSEQSSLFFPPRAGLPSVPFHEMAPRGGVGVVVSVCLSSKCVPVVASCLVLCVASPQLLPLLILWGGVSGEEAATLVFKTFMKKELNSYLKAEPGVAVAASDTLFQTVAGVAPLLRTSCLSFGGGRVQLSK